MKTYLDAMEAKDMERFQAPWGAIQEFQQQQKMIVHACNGSRKHRRSLSKFIKFVYAFPAHDVLQVWQHMELVPGDDSAVVLPTTTPEAVSWFQNGYGPTMWALVCLALGVLEDNIHGELDAATFGKPFQWANDKQAEITHTGVIDATLPAELAQAIQALIADPTVRLKLKLRNVDGVPESGLKLHSDHDFVVP